MALFNKQRFPESYQRAVGMNASDILHKNSIELVSILKKYNVLNINSTSNQDSSYFIWLLKRK